MGTRYYRLKNYNYASPGYYFVTICTKNRQCLFGEIHNGVMHLSVIGKIALLCWEQIPDHFRNVTLDTFVVMSDHVHGLIKLNYSDLFRVGMTNKFQHIIPLSIGSIVRGYTIGVTKGAHDSGFIEPIWQRNFYERVISERSLQDIREYIQNNPKNWENGV